MKVRNTSNDIDDLDKALPSLKEQPFRRKKEIEERIKAARNIQRQIEAENIIHKNTILYARHRRIYLATSFACIIIAISSLLLSDSYITNRDALYIRVSQAVIVELKEHSKLELYPIRYFFSKTVYLEGDAYFEIVPGNEFVVKTQAGSVRVLGTKFSIQQKQDTMFVACNEGKVLVQSENSRATLQAGQELKVTPLSIEFLPKEVDLPEEVQPIIKRYKEYVEFEHVPVAKVLHELETCYEVKVENIHLVDTVYYTGILLFDDINSALDIICGVAQIDYNRINNRVVLNRKH